MHDEFCIPGICICYRLRRARAHEREKTLNDPGYERRDRRIEAEVRERIAEEVRAHLAVAGIHVRVRDDIADQIARGVG